MSERLITFRLDHPIAACMEIAAQLTKRFDLLFCDVVPSDPASDSAVLGIAESAAGFLEQKLRAKDPIIVAIGTGRTLRAAVELVPRMICHQHKLVSLVGHISMQGSASFFDVLARLSELSQAPHYPMPLPVIVRFPEEREQLQRLEPVLRVLDLARNADVTLVGIGRMDEQAQLQADGFISAGELVEMRRLGAVGEVTGWAFDAAGKIIGGGTNDRVTSAPRDIPPTRLVVGVAQGIGKILPIRAALRGRIISGLITNETTARSVLEMD
jgi:DNA-binding transcriptional regulator LsrR (DeoR family)